MKKLVALALLASLAVALVASSLPAATWNATDGDFAVAGNWLDGVLPSASDTTYIANNGAAWLNSAYAASIAGLTVGVVDDVGHNGSGTFTLQTNGSLTTSGASVGYGGVSGSTTGTMNIDGGAFNSTTIIYLGTGNTNPGYGFYNQTGGAVTLGGQFYAGVYGSNSVGIAKISGGTLSTTYVAGGCGSGAESKGIWHQTGGDITMTKGFFMALQPTCYGYYDLSDGTLYQNHATDANNAGYNFTVGKYGYGVMDQTGGTVTAKARLLIGGDVNVVGTQNAYGVYNLSGGSATVCTGGTNSTYYSAVGAFGYGNGVLNLSGSGSLEVKGGTTYGRLIVGYTDNIIEMNPISGVVNLGAVATQENPDGGGGTLRVNWLEHSDSPSIVTGTVNFHGGALVARNTITANSFLHRTTNYVYGEGAVIDTNGKNVYIDTPLAAPASKGITGITLGTAGTGYTAPPVVVISDTNFTSPGTGATAIAKVTGGGLEIVMTNPGVGYSDPSTIGVTLYGGDGSGAALGMGTVTLADNVSGGLTKKGLGTLTLSAANTYTGATVVEAGTLALAATGSITSNVTIADTAALGGAGTVTGDVSVSAGGTVAAGASAGKLTIAGDLDVAATGNMTWELATLMDDAGGAAAGTDYDQILLQSGDLDLGTAAKLTLDFSLLAAADQPSADPLATFWTTSHQWKVIDVDATGGGTNSGGTDFATIAFSGAMPTKVVFDTLVGSGADLGDIFLTAAPGSAVVIPGDADGDGKVNDVDAKAVASNWGTTSGATWAMGDFNKDGAVSAADASIMAANWHYGVTEGTTVPEPAMLALLLAAGALALLVRRR